MDYKVYQKLKSRAEELGFDSVQAYVRFWAKAEIRKQPEKAADQLADPTAQALRYLELLLATSKQKPTSLQEALDYIACELKQTESLIYLQRLL